MKKFILYVFALSSAGVLTSCSEDPQVAVNGVSYEIQSYDDYLWKEDPTDTVKVYLNAEFKECEAVTGTLELAICDDDGVIVPADMVTVFVGGEKAEDNIIRIPVVNDIVNTELGFIIGKKYLSEDADFRWHLKLLSDAHLKKVLCQDAKGVEGLVDVKDDPWIYGTDILIKNTHVANSLKVWTNIIFWVILAVLAALHILSRIIHPSVRFTRLTIDYGDAEVRYDTRGAYKVVLTDKPLKVGIFHRFFVGKVCVIRNDFWTSEVTIKKAYGQNLRITTSGDYALPDEPVRREEFVIKNEEGRSATLFTN